MLTSQSAMSAGTPSLSQEAFNTFLLTESNALVISQNVENSGQPLSCADDTRLWICIIAGSVLRPGRNPWRSGHLGEDRKDSPLPPVRDGLVVPELS